MKAPCSMIFVYWVLIEGLFVAIIAQPVLTADWALH